MGGVIKILVLAVLATAAAWGLTAMPGRVSMEVAGTTIEASAAVALVAFVLVLLAGAFLIRIIGGLLRLPGLGTRWRAERRRRGGDVALTRTLVAIAAGVGNDARREAHKARRLLGDTPQTLLLAAEAARLAERDDEAEAAYRALTLRPDAALLGYRGLFRLAVMREDWAEASSLALQAERAHPNAQWLRPERSRLAVRTGNWAGALALAPSGPESAALAVAAARAEGEPGRSAAMVKQAWKRDPTLAPAVQDYAAQLRAAGKEKTAQSVLRHAWTLAPQPDLAVSALAPVTEPLARVQAAQRLTSANPEHPESRLLLARASLEAGLVGEARHQAEAALASGLHQRRLYLLLAEIAEAEGGATAAVQGFLRQAADADADSAWRCESCHAGFPTWHAACPSCSAPGTLRWKAV
jgi:HemY protein